MIMLTVLLTVLGVAIAAVSFVVWHDWMLRSGRINIYGTRTYRGFENRATWLCTEQLLIAENLEKCKKHTTRQEAFDLAYHYFPMGIEGCKNTYKLGRIDWNDRSEKKCHLNVKLGDIEWGEVADEINDRVYITMEPTVK